MKYIELLINTREQEREEIETLVSIYDIYTYEEESFSILDELNKSEKDWDFVDEEVFNIEKNSIIIKVYFSDIEIEKVNKIRKELDIQGIISEIREFEDEDWMNNWKKFYKPLEIGNNIVIKPSWEEYENSNNKIIIEIDPGMAFGTGTHETTSLCLETLEEHIKKDDVVFDIGCGSGILGIAAIKLGAKKSVLVDIDDKCIEVSKINSKLNNVEDKTIIYKGNLLDVVKGEADIIVSNIIAEIIVTMIVDLKKHLKNNGIFIASGIIKEKLELVKNSLIENNFEIMEIKELNGWCKVVAKMAD